MNTRRGLTRHINIVDDDVDDVVAEDARVSSDSDDSENDYNEFIRRMARFKRIQTDRNLSTRGG